MNPVKKNAEDDDKQMDIDEFDNDKMQVVKDKKEDKAAVEEEFDLDDMSDDDDENMFAKPAKKEVEEEKGGNSDMIVKVRKYDLSITYDFYT